MATIEKHFVHRTNTLDSFFRHYNGDLQPRAFEIDVQCFDGKIVVFHDDVGGLDGLGGVLPYVPTLEKFLRFTPHDITLNVELKVYSLGSVKGFVREVLQICNKYKKNGFCFSSFHAPTVQALKEAQQLFHVWILADDWQQYADAKDAHTHICVNADLYKDVQWELHDAVGIYNCTLMDAKAMNLADFYIVDIV